MTLRVDLTKLFACVKKMGADNMPGVKITGKYNPIDKIDIDLSEGNIELTLDKVETTNGLFSYKGRQILLYIKDHGWSIDKALADGSQGKKFHLCHCKTLRDMMDKGRFDRYVAINKLDGIFPITGYSKITHNNISGSAKLKVCKNCLLFLRYKGYIDHTMGKKIFTNFTLKDFFSTYSTFFPHMPKNMGDNQIWNYSKDWKKISKKYKNHKNYTCESCGVQLSEHPKLLHVHHKNGIKDDNIESNLKCLCSDCHRKQEFHSHMFITHEDMQLISKLRTLQGHSTTQNWDEVFSLADTSVHGIIHACRQIENWNSDVPEVGYELIVANKGVVAQFELAWPSKKIAVMTESEGVNTAQNMGWKVMNMTQALEYFSQ